MANILDEAGNPVLDEAGGNIADETSGLSWSGYTWTVRAPSTGTAPGPNAWSDSSANVSVDSGGNLLMSVVWDGTYWRCVELDGPQLGYGTYTWVLNTDPCDWDKIPVLGLFTYDFAGSSGTFFSENDIEVSLWNSDSELNRFWFTVQPGGDRLASQFPASHRPPYTCTMIWQAGQIYFRVADTARVIGEHLVTTGTQAPGAAQVCMNLWLAGGSPPEFGQNITVSLKSFTFAASTTYTLATASAYLPSFAEPALAAGRVLLPRCGDQCTTDSYGTGTQASAITAWQGLTGRTLQVRRVYFPGTPPSSITADLAADAAAGRAVAMSFKPPLATTSGGGNSAARTTIDGFLSSCKAAGLIAMVCMYHEPVTEIGNANTYQFTQQYYGPTVRTYYPLVYGGQCGDFAHGSLANYQAYFVAGQFDAAMVDYYPTSSWSLASSTLMDGHAAFTDSQGLSSFGTWEFGVDEDVVSTGVSTAWWNYMASFYAARVSAKKGVGYLTHFSLLTPDGVAGHPFSNAAATYEIPLFQALWDASQPVAGALISANSKTPALYVLAGSGGVAINNLAAAQTLTGVTFKVLEVFNTNVPLWSDWENPWFAKDSSQGYTSWVAADPTNRQLIISYNLISNQGGSMTDPLTWETTGSTGGFNTHATALARNLVAAGLGSSIIRLGLECNGNWNIDSIGGSASGGGTVQMRNLWAQTFAQEVTAMRAVTGANFLFCWCPNAVVAGVPFADYYPGDASVDIIGIDAYDAFASGSQPAPSAATTTSLFGQAYGLTDITTFAVSHSKPLALGQWGTQLGGASGGLGDDPYYIQGIANWITTNNVAFHSYFDSNTANIIPLSTSYPLTLNAYKAAFGGVPGAPVVITNAATGVAATTATLNGTVNPQGASTTYQFEYGTTTGYGTVVPASPGSAGSGSTAVAESYSLAGLTASRTYHYRLNATNASGTTHGADQQFTTTAAGGGGVSMAVTATCSNFNNGGALKVFAVTGATETGGASAQLQVFGPAADTVSLTPAGSGSLILFGIFERNTIALTAAASNSFTDTGGIASAYTYAEGKYTGTVTGGTPVTVGASTAPNDWNDIAAYELKPSAPGWALAQQAAGSAAAAANSPQVTVTATRAGSLLTAVFTRSGGLTTGALTGVTDSAGNTWQLATRGAVSGTSNTRAEVWYALNAASVTWVQGQSGTSQTWAWNVQEWTGATSVSLDEVSPDGSATASSTSAATPPVSAAATAELVLAAAHYPQATGTLASTGWTALTDFDDGSAGSGRAAYYGSAGVANAPPSVFGGFANPASAQALGHTEPEVKLFGSTYYCYYRDDTSGHGRINLMTSTDGATWTEQGTLLDVTAAAWDSSYVISPSVVFDGTTYYLFYEGNNGSFSAVGYATATAPGGPFTKYASNPVLSKTGSGFESVLVGTPAVLYNAGTFWLFYHGYDGTHDQVALAWASSPSGTWTRHSGNPVLPVTAATWTAGKVAPSSVVLVNGIIYVFIEADPGTGKFAIGVAQVTLAAAQTAALSLSPGSVDAPLLSANPAGWDNDYVQLPGITQNAAGGWWLYYSGHSTAGSFSLGRSVTGSYNPYSATWTLGTAHPAGVLTAGFRGTLAIAPPAVNSSTPSVVTGLTSPLSTATFTPPGGAVLVAVVMASTTAASTIGITENSGLGLTWTQRAIVTQTGSLAGVAAIYTATIPAGSPSGSPATGITITPSATGSKGAGIVGRGQLSNLTQASSGSGTGAITPGLSASNYQASGTTVTVTIPAVAAGDAVICLGMACQLGTLTLTSTGTTPSQLGSTLATTSAEHGLWTFIASGTDAGKVLTLTCSVTGKLALALFSYTGASTTALIDVSATHSDSALATATHTAPTVTTVTGNDWVIQGLTCKDTTTTSWTVPGTQRVSRLGSGGGSPSVVLTDNNASVAAGTTQGGGNFVSGQSVTSANAITWTVAITPSITSCVVTWPVNPAVGNSILLFVQSGNPALAPTSVVDNGTTPTTFTLDASNTSVDGAGNYIYRADGITLPSSGSYAVTVTISSARTLQAAGIEYIGKKAGGPDATATNQSAGGTAVTTGSCTPSTAGGVVFGGFSDLSALNPETVTFAGSAPQASQFTNTNGATWWPFGVADALTGSAQNLSWTLGDSVAWAGAAVAYSPPTAVLSGSPSTGITLGHSATGTPRIPGSASIGITITPYATGTSGGTGSASTGITIIPSATGLVGGSSGPPVFPVKPLGIKTELLINGTWTDISAYMYQRNPVQITSMGRADWTSTIQAAQLSMTLNNRDGRFTPKNTAGVFYPYITRNVQIRVSVNSQSVTGIVYAGTRFYGEVIEWPPQWDPSSHDIYVDITAAGIWQRLSQLITTLGSAYRRYIAGQTGSAAPRAYWPMEDGTGSTGLVPFASASGTPNATWAFVTGEAGLSLAANSDFRGSDGIPQVNASAITFIVPAGGTATNNFTRFLMSVPATGDSASGTTNWNLLEVDSAGTVAKFEVYLNATGTLLMQLRNSGGTVIAAGTTTTNVKGQPYLVSAELAPSGGNVLFALSIIKPGSASITETISGTLTSATVGAISTVKISRAMTLMDTAVGHLAVFYGTPPTLVNSQWPLNGYLGELAMNRFTRLCGEMGIVAETIGAASATAAMGPQFDDTLASLLQTIEDTDCGLLYESRSQFGLGYRSNASMANQAAAATFSYTSALLDPSLAPVFDNSLTRNNITVTNWTGYRQQAILTAGPMSVLNPPAGIGNGYAYTRDVFASSDTQIPGIANFLLNVGSVDEIRFPVVTLKQVRTQNAAQFAIVPGLRIGDYFQITNLPPHGGPATAKQLMWGYAETLNAKEWTFAFNTVPETPWETGFSPGTIQTAQIPGGSASTSQSPGAGGIGGIIANGSITPAMLNSGITIRTLGGTAVTISAAAPATPNLNDMWIASATGLISQWNGTTWSPVLFDGTATIQAGTITSALIKAGTIVSGNIAAGTITAALLAAGIVVAGIVDATTITGALMQTAPAPPQVQIDGPRDSIFGYDASANLLFSLAGVAGTDFFGHAYPAGLFAQQLTLNDQASAPSVVPGATVLYSSPAGRLRYLASSGENLVVERGSINVSTFTAGNTTTPTVVSGGLSYYGVPGSNQSSTFEIEINGAFHTGASATQQTLFQLFADGTGFGNTITIGAAALNVNSWYAYSMRFRLSVLASGSGGTAVVVIDGTVVQQSVAIGSVANTHLSVGATTSSVAFNSTVNHTLAVRGWFNGSQASQEIDTYITRTTNYS